MTSGYVAEPVGDLVEETAAQVKAQALSDAAQAHRDIDAEAIKGLKVGESLSDETGQAGQVQDIRLKKYVRRWHTETGRMYPTLPYLVADLTRRVFSRSDTGPTGQPIWVFRDPGIINQSLGVNCYLHRDEEGSAQYFKMGFRPCTKQHIPYEDARERHMETKHKRAWKAIKANQEKQAKAEAADMQKATMDALVKVAELAARGAGTGGTIVPAEVEEQVMATGEAVEVNDPFSVQCSHCEHIASGKTAAGAHASLRGHENRVHPKE